MTTTMPYGRALLAALALTVLGGSPAAADQIICRDRTIDGVEVIEETYEKVTYKIHGSTQQEAAGNVERVVYALEPSPYRAGRELMAAGRYAEAATQFVDAARGRGWVEQYGLFYAAECQRLAAQTDQAASTYEELLSKHPKTRFYPAAKLGLGLVRAAAGDHDGARAAFADLERDARDKSLGDRWMRQAQLEIARSHERSGSLDEAKGLYRRLTREKRDFPAIGYAAELGELRCGDTGDRQTQGLERLIDEKDCPWEVRAEAYLALGKALSQKGEAKRALLAFLRVCWDPPLIVFPAPRAEALFEAAKAFEAAKTANWREHAEALRNELKREYPTSSWARQ